MQGTNDTTDDEKQIKGIPKTARDKEISKMMQNVVNDSDSDHEYECVNQFSQSLLLQRHQSTEFNPLPFELTSRSNSTIPTPHMDNHHLLVLQNVKVEMKKLLKTHKAEMEKVFEMHKAEMEKNFIHFKKSMVLLFDQQKTELVKEIIESVLDALVVLGTKDDTVGRGTVIIADTTATDIIGFKTRLRQRMN